MTVTISSAIASIADISVKVYPARLTTRQQTSLAKQVRTGVVRGNAAASQLAIILLRQAGVPYVHLRARGYIQWYGVPLDPTHPLREALITAHAASLMHSLYKDHYPWQKQHGIPSVGERVRNVETCFDWAQLVKPARDAAFKTASAGNAIAISDVIDWRV
jgi:hypothetical protein